jgi:flagellar hook-associated protein 3 FlgL
MRIATSTIFDNQTLAMDNLVYQQQQLGTELSTGKVLNEPSDDPTAISQDLSLHTTISSENVSATNIANATAKLTTTDSALATLTAGLQSARQLAIEGATEVLTTAQRQAIGGQIDQILSQAVDVANTNYAGNYIFAGTSSLTTAPVATQGSPVSSITFSGNFQTESQSFAPGQSFALSVSMQQAFNYQAADGTPNAFQVLVNLRNTLNNAVVSDYSSSPVNRFGQVLNTNTTLASAVAGGMFNQPLTADSAGDYTITIDGAPNQGTGSPAVITFTPQDTIGQIVAKIDATTAQTGVTATFNVKSQQLFLTSSNGATFNVTDTSTPSPPAATAATNTSNFTGVFGLSTTADFVQNVSTQIGDIDSVLDKVLNTRAVIGGRIDALNQIADQNNLAITDNTKVQSNIEDTDIPTAVTAFSQTQTALQAAYSTTDRLEGKILFDYIT